MRLIPVLDLSGGIAVHARAGLRQDYQPVRSALAPDAAGDPLVLARAYRERLGAGACYVADLDAIQGGEPQRALLRAIAAPGGFGGELLVDAGVADVARAEEVVAAGATRVVVGLETLRSFGDLARIVRAVGGARVVFSLDLRMGQPLLHPELDAPFSGGTPVLRIAAAAVASGAGALVVLDLARIGVGRGVDVALLAALRRYHPDVSLLAGGGISGRDDLDQLAELGCDGALVASAVHGGRLTSEDVRRVERRRPADPPG